MTDSQVPEEAVKKFVNAGYRMAGTHSAVSICHWTKESLRRNRVCYKEKWYGIESHRCLEMTPSLVWCTHQCQFCWRSLKFTEKGEPEPDDPSVIIDECIKARESLLMGFKGNDAVERKKWDEAINPTSAAISLAGEPTMYPRISDMIGEFKRRKMITFLVTNGTRPDRLESLDHEPTNLYISVCAPDEETYNTINRPMISDGWNRLNTSLEMMGSFDCRKIMRLTLVRGMNMDSPKGYAKLVLKANPDFIEPKGYSWVGESRERLSESNVPSLDDIREFSKSLSEETGYSIEKEDEASRVLLLKR